MKKELDDLREVYDGVKDFLNVLVEKELKTLEEAKQKTG